jgi:hypothetical protein
MIVGRSDGPRHTGGHPGSRDRRLARRGAGSPRVRIDCVAASCAAPDNRRAGQGLRCAVRPCSRFLAEPDPSGRPRRRDRRPSGPWLCVAPDQAGAPGQDRLRGVGTGPPWFARTSCGAYPGCDALWRTGGSGPRQVASPPRPVLLPQARTRAPRRWKNGRRKEGTLPA